jgi:hypothetical protein
LIVSKELRRREGGKEYRKERAEKAFQMALFTKTTIKERQIGPINVGMELAQQIYQFCF